MTAQEIRNAYLKFFEDRGHKVIPRALLVPYNDPTTLFTGSGMQPLIPYLLGEPHTEGNRLVDSQTCLRAQDIEEVGDNRHTTFFEMLGNWSLGDYFKAEEIPWLFEFLVDAVGLDPQKLYVTCYLGNEEFGIPKDAEASKLWQELFAKKGVAAETVDIGSEADGYQKGMGNGRVFFYDGSKNWWSRADHLRAATFLAVDDVKPSNKEQGYVMRRLIRRAIRYAFDLGVEQNFLEQVVPVITDLYKDDFPEVAAKRDEVIEVLAKEEKVFRQTLRKGLNEFTKMTGSKLTGEVVFKLYDTYGFPVELSKEEAFKREIDVADNADQEFEKLMAEQRARSQTAAKGTFKGGLGGHTMQHKKYHTATHLMYQAMRDVLGGHVVQRGSNITEERLRFDFSHPEKVTPEQLKEVEDIVNEQIQKDLQVSFKEYPTQVAIEEKGALGQFGDRYGDTVKVYSMQADGEDKPFSFEICGGPHVDHTLQLAEDGKKFKILKEESSSAGIRRIKAVLA
jgi:alanyl-tRNA synthetase